MKSTNHKPFYLSVYFLLALIVLTLAVIPALFLFGRTYHDWFETGKNPTSLGDVANWVQAFFALISLGFVAVAATQIFEMRKQTKMQQERAESDAYRVLISARMQSTKRFLASKAVNELFSSLESETAQIPSEDTESLRESLEQLRNRLGDIAKSIDLPLLGRPASLDDIEALINEYNFLAKQLLDGQINPTFATDLGIANFKTVHKRVKPFIELRLRISRAYASHFTKYVETLDCK